MESVFTTALVVIVIASAVIPTMIATFFFLPKHLLPKAVPEKAKRRIAYESGLDEK